MLPNYLASIKSSGIYRFVFDKSEMPAPEAEILRLVVGYSEKGPFNTPVYVTNEDEFKKIFGGRSKKLERYGMWFHRLAIQALKAGPILALNLKNFENPFNEGTPGYENWGKYNRVDFTTFNPNESIFNIGELAEIEDNLQMAIKDIYNTDRFWTLEPEQLEEYVNNHDEDAGGHDFEAGYITIATTDSKESSATVFMRGYTPKGYDVPFMEWYSAVLNGAELPTYLEGHERDLVSQYFAEVYIFKGEFTPEIASSDKLAKFFNVDGETVTLKPYILNAFGEKVDTLDALASNDASNFINKYQGILLPDFRNANNTVISLDALVNGDNYIHKLMMRFNQDMLYSIEPDGDFQLSDLDTTGWNLGPFVGERYTGTPYRMMSFTDLDPVVYIGEYSIENGWVWETEVEDHQGLPADYYGVRLESDSEAVTIDGNSLRVSSVEDDPDSEELISALNALNIQVGEPIIFMYPDSNPNTHVGFTQPLHVTQINQTENETDVYKVNGEGKSYKFRPTSERLTSSVARGKYTVKSNGIDDGYVECDLIPFWDVTNEMLWLQAKISNSTSQSLPVGGQYPAFFIPFESIYTAKTPGETSTFEIYDDQFTQIQDIDLTTLEFYLPIMAVKVGYTITGETDPRVCDLVLMDIPDDRDHRIKFQVFDCDYEIEEGHDPYEMFQNGDTIYFNEVDEDNQSNYKLFFGNGQIPEKIDGAIRYGSSTEFHPDLNIFGGFEGASTIFLDDWYIVEFDASEGAPLYYAAQPTIDQVHITLRTIEWVFDSELPDHIMGMFRCVGSVTSNTSTNVCPLYLHGYTFGNPKPETTKQYDKLQWQHYMLDALKNYRGLRIALTSRVDLEYRYLIDTFEGFVEAECKAMLSTICKEKDNTFGILNFPQMKNFSKCDYIHFTNENNEFDTKYIPMGGNPMKPMSGLFTLPSQENGASWCGFFTALRIRDIDTGVKEDVPAAALVSNNFMTKYSTYYPYTIIAGTKRGVLREQGLIGPDFNFCREDLDNLEPFGVNCMVYVDRKGTCINSNQTAKQNPVTTLSKINVRELVIFLQDEIEKLLLDYHWDFNTPNLRQRIEDRANVILETAKNNGGVYKYLNQCSDDNNTDDVINNEMLILDTSIEPGMGAGKMVQRLYIYRKGGMSSMISES